MKPIEILEKIVEEASVQNSSKSILAVYRQAFNSSDDIELFKLRALYIELMEASLVSAPQSKNTLQTFNEIYKGLTYFNLGDNIQKIAPKMTAAHLTSMEAIFALHKFKQDFEAVSEIETLNEDLKTIIDTEEMTPEQKEIILELSQDIDKAIFEHEITGNYAIKKLHEKWLSKLMINRKIIESIQNPSIKEKLGAIYSKIDSLNSVINTVVSLASKANAVLDLLSNGGN